MESVCCMCVLHVCVKISDKKKQKKEVIDNLSVCVLKVPPEVNVLTSLVAICLVIMKI